jgi:hypothetical protein
MQHIPDIVSVLMNFHPRFGLADETRIKTLRDAERRRETPRSMASPRLPA